MTAALYKRTRIAPTPSGYLHLGNVLSFAVTVALTRNNDVKVLLRIDDLDRARVNKLYIQDIFDTLNFLGIPWDEGPRDAKDFEDNYSQLHRMDLYIEALEQLADQKFVFACICSRRQVSGSGNSDSCPCAELNIPLATENSSWRLMTMDHDPIVVKDYNDQVTKVFLPAEMHNFVVKKKDGFPAYQLTSVIDDLFYDVDLIVRGEDLWPSTLAQHQLAASLRKNTFNDISFYHHPLLTEPSGKKLSKSEGATSIKYLRESGLKPVQVYNLIASMLGVKENVSNWEKLAQLIIPGK
ncbi:MAG TPA: glutamate--tRNA ligase family protein [Mucilaginibacter sp.]